jgi:hypothetical protein
MLGVDSMMHKNDFTCLERRLYAEGNPLVDELVNTRDCLIELLHEANAVVKKYSPAINELSKADDLDFFREWDDFGDSIENLSYDLGVNL